MSEQTTNVKSNDALENVGTLYVAGVALILIGFGGLIFVAGEAIYVAYGPVPLLCMFALLGFGMVGFAKRLITKRAN